MYLNKRVSQIFFCSLGSYETVYTVAISKKNISTGHCSRALTIMLKKVIQVITIHLARFKCSYLSTRVWIQRHIKNKCFYSTGYIIKDDFVLSEVN